MTTFPKNQPKEKYTYGFKMDAYCTCSPPCGEWLLYHYTVDMEGKEWTDMGKHFSSKEELLEHIVKNHLPTEYVDYTPFKAQAVMEI